MNPWTYDQMSHETSDFIPCSLIPFNPRDTTIPLLLNPLQLPQLVLHPFDALLALERLHIRPLHGHLQLGDVLLQLLLHPHRLGAALGLGLQRGLHRLHLALVAAARVLELLLLLLDAPLDLLARLAQLQLAAEDLVLLLLQRRLGLLQGRLQLLLLLLHPLPELLHLGQTGGRRP